MAAENVPDGATRLIPDNATDFQTTAGADEATRLMPADDAETQLLRDDAETRLLRAEEVEARLQGVPDPEDPPASIDDYVDEPTTLMAEAHDGIDTVVEPEDVTSIYPQPAPLFDEEQEAYHGGYTQALDRLDVAYQDPHPKRPASIPHIDDDDGRGRNVPGEGRSRSFVRPFLAFLLVGTMVAGIVAAGAYGLELWGGKHLPNVVGLSETKAREALESKGFVVDVQDRIADDAIGFVLEQDPESGIRAEEGTHVTIVVAVNRVMPDVVGRTQEEAIDLLWKAGAGEVRVEQELSDQEEGRVLSVTPAAGESFTSHQTVTLVVAEKPVVPDVLGKERAEAVAALENAGFVVKTHTVMTDETPNTVVSQDPEPETKVDPGATVSLAIAQSAPTNVLHFLEYFEKDEENLAQYLTNQGFWQIAGYRYNDHAEAAYASDDMGRVYFTSTPFSHRFDFDADTGEDVLASGVPFMGIRWEVPSDMLPDDVSSLDGVATNAIMEKCGLNNTTDVCMHQDVELPEGTKKGKARFRCTYGEMGNYSWTVLIVIEDDVPRAVVTVAPKKLYTEWYDLSEFGDSICDMVAYADVYTE